MTRTTPTLTAAEHSVLDDIRILEGKKRRRLNKQEKEELLQLFAIKSELVVSIEDLAPPGTILARAVRHFLNTDISLVMPVMQLVMLAASHLTQIGAYLDVPGVGRIRPTIWNVVLAASGSSKTLAKDEIFRALSGDDGVPPVAMMPTAGSDAQWIEGMREHNGTYWLQDETGKYFNKVLRDSLFRRMKPWLLDAHSHQQIDNILKTAEDKTIIPDPHFTFLGLGVAETWAGEVDAVSMLDGFCQRFNYVLAPPRSDTDTFEHFLYFQGEKVEDARAQLRENWQALRGQPGAAEPYRLNDEVLPYLEAWWRDLRETWGKTAVPASFIRRIGYSVLRYLPVLHFLLGKSRWLIDVETAELGTRFAELHFQSVFEIMRQYDPKTSGSVGIIMKKRQDLLSNNVPVTKRAIMRKLSKSQRNEVGPEMTAAVLAALEKFEEIPGLIDGPASPREKSAALLGRRDEVRARFKLNERKRNERRIRNLVKALHGNVAVPDPSSDRPSTTSNVNIGPGLQTRPSGIVCEDPSRVVDDMFGFPDAAEDQPSPENVQTARIVQFTRPGTGDP